MSVLRFVLCEVRGVLSPEGEVSVLLVALCEEGEVLSVSAP